MAERLTPGGIAITNVLPVPGRPWKQLLAQLSEPFDKAAYLVLDDWENRVLLAGPGLPSPRQIGCLLRDHLDAIGSEEANGLEVRNLR